jgi:ParB family chromosome partitioning protein
LSPRTCQGHAAYLEVFWEVDDDAEDDERLANNKAWRAAETVHREWLKYFATHKTAPKGAARYIFTELAQGDHQLRDGMEKQHAFARELLGLDEPGPSRYRKYVIMIMAVRSAIRRQPRSCGQQC